MSITGRTKLIGIIGRGIEYTLSPRLHNAAIASFQLEQVYVPFDVQETTVPQLLNVLWELGAIGLNITKPYKKFVATLCETTCSSVNTLYRGEHGWLGASTDGAGFAKGLQQLQLDLTKGDVSHLIFLGFGGAALGIIEYLSQQHICPKAIALCTRSSIALEPLQILLPQTTFLQCDWRHGTADLLNEAPWQKALLVQASSAPQQGDDLKWLQPQLKNFAGSFVDLCYGDKVSSLFHWAKSRNLLVQDGYPMLIEQARLSQELWWGKSLDFLTLYKLMQR